MLCNVFAIKQYSRHTNGLSRVLLSGSQKQPSPEQTVTMAYLALPLLTFPAMLNVVRAAKEGFYCWL